MRLRVLFRSLGCKLNQLETESLADAFARSGADVAAGVAADATPDAEDAAEVAEGGSAAAHGAAANAAVDLLVLNSCTVTSKAEQKARRIVRQVLADNPDAAVIVTGCYAQVEAEAVAALGDRVLVVPGEAKDALLRLPSYLADNRAEHEDLIQALNSWKAESLPGRNPFAFEPSSFVFHSRPSLKIQDGCDNCCAYCRVRIARGPSISLDPALALERARRLEASGAVEIVLTGVNLSQYSRGELDFPGLLSSLLAGTERVAFRLSSYEPDKIDAGFLEAFADPRVRPHVHLAVQSGSDPVLAAMGRRYRRDTVLGAVQALRSAKGDPFIGADLIVGFPGETDSDAASTFELAEECDFAWIHAFRFSPRPGTKAERMKNRVPERVAGERAEELARLARKGKDAFIARWLGAEVESVTEGEAAPDGDARSAMRATSENYIKITIRGLPLDARPGLSVVARLESHAEPASHSDATAVYLHDKQ